MQIFPTMGNQTLTVTSVPFFESTPYLTNIWSASNLYLPLFLASLLAFYTYEAWRAQKDVEKSEVPFYMGWWSAWLPRVLHNGIYAFKASSILVNGYTKFKQKAFQLIRNDTNIIVLPQSLLEQLSSLPEAIASPHGALEQDLLGPHTGLNLILESRLHHSIVQRKLTPRLPLLTPALQQEVAAAVEEYFPSSTEHGADEWVRFQPYQILAKVSARLAGRALVGPELCKNDKWLDISVNYTESLFRTIVVLRLFPTWTHRALRYLLPSYWNGQNHVRAAKSLLGPIIQDLLDKNDRGEWSPVNNVAESNVLCWLVETAKGRDRDAETLAHVEVLLALASVHTTLLRMVNILYDTTADSECMRELSIEIDQTFDAEGGNWAYSSYARLEKLDSVMRESQRMSPPTILGLKRLFKQSFTFDDGTHVPRGSYVTMPIYAIENDPRVTPNPAQFDGLRSYRLRQMQKEDQEQKDEAPKSATKRDEYQFSTPEPTVLNFGYGKTACPGRYFASLAVKMVLVKLLTEFEFRFADGEGRPNNLLVHEFLFCWPWQWMEMKKRKDSSCPF